MKAMRNQFKRFLAMLCVAAMVFGTLPTSAMADTSRDIMDLIQSMVNTPAPATAAPQTPVPATPVPDTPAPATDAPEAPPAPADPGDEPAEQQRHTGLDRPQTPPHRSFHPPDPGMTFIKTSHTGKSKSWTTFDGAAESRREQKPNG